MPIPSSPIWITEPDAYGQEGLAVVKTADPRASVKPKKQFAIIIGMWDWTLEGKRVIVYQNELRTLINILQNIEEELKAEAE